MPKGFIIFTEQVNDPEGLSAYVEAALPTIVEAGGRPIAFDQSPQSLEGEWHGTQTVVLEFDSPDAARAWYESPAYQELIPKRQAAADANAAIITGIE